MSAPFNDESLRHHSNDVSILDRGQAVGNDDAGTPFSGLIQRCLHSLKATDKVSEWKYANQIGAQSWKNPIASD